jgi:signal transduction histidine kinase/CheY-like chemotaxis protein
MPTGIQRLVSRHTRTFFLLVLLFSAYFITGKAGLGLGAVHNFATLVWPPTGIALAGLLLFGRRLWPAIFLGAFAVNYSIGVGVPVSIGIALGNTLEALLGAYLLQEIFNIDFSFGRLSDVISLLFVSVCAPIVSASIGVATLYSFGFIGTVHIVSTWSAWEIGDVLGVLIFTPLFLTWFSINVKSISTRELLEFALICAFSLLASFLAFFAPVSHAQSVILLYLVPIPVLWSVLRFGPRVTTLNILIVAAVSTAATMLGYGPFRSEDIIQGLFYSRIFVGAFAGLALLFTSVVEERRRAMLSLQAHVEDLQIALAKISSEDEAKNEFLAILAHELRNPLAPIVSSLEILELKNKDEVSPAIMRTMHTHIDTMVRLLDDLLDISRISRKKLQLQKEDAVIQTLIKRSLQMVEHMFRDKKITVELHLPEEPLHCYVDPVRVEQIIVNLLTNAAKYTEQDGSVTIVASQVKNMIELRVKDTGIGIPKNMLERIFDPFQQIENKRRQSTGLGIGLTLTKSLVAMHSGEISAHSAGLGHGSEFIVRLPLLSPPPSSKVERPESTFRKNKTILVVDDNKAAAHSLCKLLEMRGNNVHAVYSGKEALLEIKHFLPQLILLDIGLPDINGEELAKKIRKILGGKTRIVAVSGYGSGGNPHKKATSFDQYLTKPVSFTDIEKILEQE